MSIEYKYTIIKVDEAARCMEIIYEAQGHMTMHIGARLPFEGEALINVIKAFAPVQMWINLASAVVVPEIGVTGVIPIEVVTPVAENTVEDAEFSNIFPTRASGGINTAIFK